MQQIGLKSGISSSTQAKACSPLSASHQFPIRGIPVSLFTVFISIHAG
jgi:hypothetical protein